MDKNDREFKCVITASKESLKIDTHEHHGKVFEFEWCKERVGGEQNVFLSRESCGRLVKQLQHFIDHGCLLPEEPPEPTSDAMTTAKRLLAIVGLEVDPDQMRVIQDTKEEIESEHD